MQSSEHAYTPQAELSSASEGSPLTPAPEFIHGSLGALGARKFRLLCEGVGVPELADAAAELFHTMCEWSDWPAGDTPLWPTDVSDDGTPFEYSLAFDGGEPKVRFLMEAQQAELGAKASWAAGLRLAEQLGRLDQVDLTRFHLVTDLFAPCPEVSARFSLWHGATLRPDGSAAFKVYFNPQIQGPAAARGLVKEAFERLGLREALDRLLGSLPEGGRNNRLVFFSLDLSKTAEARVKLYIAHDNATQDSVESDLAGVEGYQKGDAKDWIEQLVARDGPFDARPMLTCFGFTSPKNPPAVTVYVPVRCYSPSDSHTIDRVCELLAPQDGLRLREGLDRMAGRPLDVGRGLVTYVALRRHASGLNITTYAAPEVYGICAARPSAYPREIPRHSMIQSLRPRLREEKASATMADIELEIAALSERLARHPFLRRLDSTGRFDDIRAMTPRLTFFVLSFQDMLRLVYERTKDVHLKSMAHVHALEDKGHDQWFLHDLQRFGIPLDLRLVYGGDHKVTRDLSYEIISEVIRAEDDYARLAIVLSLEAAGHEFFGRVIGFLERIGHDDGLKYFARQHQEVEENHDLFDGDTHSTVSEMPLTKSAYSETLRAVRQTFAALTRLATHLEEAVVTSSVSRERRAG